LQHAARATVQREMGLDYLPSTRPMFMPEWLRVLLSGAQGVGKSAALVGDIHKAKLSGRKGTRGVLHETSGIVSLILAPDNVKTDELASDYQANITANSPPAFRLRGRSQKDPAQGGRAMCWIPKAAEKAAKKDANVKKSICAQCPYADDCGYLKQEAELARLVNAGDGVAIFAPHDYAFLPLPHNFAPQIVVIDEALRDDGIELHSIALDSLGTPLKAEDSGRASSIIGKTAEQADAAAVNLQYIQPLRVALRDAFRDAPDAPYAALRAAGFDAVRITAAINGLALFEETELENSLSQAVQQWKFSDRAGGAHKGLESSIEAALDAKDAKQTRKVKALFEAVLKDMERGHDAGNAAWRGRFKGEWSGTVYVADLRKIYFKDSTPMLNMDGTADIKLTECVFGPLTHHYYPVERTARTIQVTGHKFTIGSLTGESKEGVPLGQDSVERATALRKAIADVATRYPAPLIVASKRVKEAMIADGITAETAHYKALRGRNDWEDCQTVLIAGPQTPPARAIEAKARAYAGNDPTAAPFQSIGDDRWHNEARALRMNHNGGPQMIEVDCHPDPWAERVLRQTRDAEIMQAIDRVRLIYGTDPKTVIIMAAVVLDITIDEVVTWADLKAGGSRIERARATGGVISLHKREACTLYPEIWKSEGTAQRDMAEMDILVKSLLDQTVISISLITKWSIKDARLCEYKTRLKKGRTRATTHRALVWADTAEEARAKLESLTGPLQAFAEVEGWIAARDAAQDALDDWEERAARLEYSEGYTQQDAERIASGLPPVPPRPEIGPDVVPIPDAPTQKPAPVVPFRIETHYSDRPAPPPRRTAGAVP
jgi:hypothetical protein